MKKRTKRVEYKDTFEFALFPQYTYTREQNRRFLLFQGRVEHWRRDINYAASLTSPNRIGLLYMIGYDKRMKAYLDKIDANVVVLCAKISTQLLNSYDTYQQLIKRYRQCGYADKDGMLTSSYYEFRETRTKYRGTGAIPEELYVNYDKEDAIIDGYAQLKEEIARCFESYTVIERGRSEHTMKHSEINILITRRYPYGRESCGVGAGAYRSLQKVQSAIQAGLEHTDASKLLELNGQTDSYTACIKGIRRCQMNISVALREHGAVDLKEMFERMKTPPYGWDNEPHAAYCFGYAMSKYLNDTWIWDSVSCFPMHESAESTIRSIVHGDRNRRSIWLILEPAYRLSNRIAFIFDIFEDVYSPRDELDQKILSLHRAGMSERGIADVIGTISNIAVHKRLIKMRSAPPEQVPFCLMSNRICRKIEATTRYPVSILDERLRDVLLGDWNGTEYVHYPVWGRRRENAELSYFSPEKCKEIKNGFKQINTLVPDLIRKRYGDTVDMDKLHTFCTTQCSGWLWSREMFWDTVEKYLTNMESRNQDEISIPQSTHPPGCP